jgi:hypothetical protein
VNEPFTVRFESRITATPASFAIRSDDIEPAPARLTCVPPASVAVPAPVIVPSTVTEPPIESGPRGAMFSVAPAATVRSRQETAPAPAVEAACGVPAGITALVNALGAPALQLPAVAQAELVAPVQVVVCAEPRPAKTGMRNRVRPRRRRTGIWRTVTRGWSSFMGMDSGGQDTDVHPRGGRPLADELLRG